MEQEHDSTDIPAITIKKVKNENQLVVDTDSQEFQRILPMQICDIFLSQIAKSNYKSPLYVFKGNVYKHVQIVGTVVNKIIKTDHKISIGVDDGTGVISCYVESTKFDYKSRSFIEKKLEQCSYDETMDKDELLSFGDMSYTEFSQKIGNRERTFMNSCAKMLGEKIKKSFKNYPLVSEINLGDNVKIMGNVSDYNNYRFIFVINLCRLGTAEETVYEMTKIFESKDKMCTGK